MAGATGRLTAPATDVRRWMAAWQSGPATPDAQLVDDVGQDGHRRDALHLAEPG